MWMENLNRQPSRGSCLWVLISLQLPAGFAISLAAIWFQLIHLFAEWNTLCFYSRRKNTATLQSITPKMLNSFKVWRAKHFFCFFETTENLDNTPERALSEPRSVQMFDWFNCVWLINLPRFIACFPAAPCSSEKERLAGHMWNCASSVDTHWGVEKKKRRKIGEWTVISSSMSTQQG